MLVRRFLSFSLIFALGVGVGMALLHASSTLAASATEAQQRALRVLDKSPVAASIGDNRIVTAVQKIAPAVVNIDTIGPMPTASANPASGMTMHEVRGKGSGVIFTSDGYIVTNNHVIDGASRIRVTLQNNRWYYAHTVGYDPQTDLAIVRVEAKDLPTAELGDSDKLQVGEWAIAVGNPLGLGSTITVGVISALNRHNLQIEEGRTLEGAIQTDAAINRGNSGGALANINGQLVGINTAILSSTPTGGNIGLGFSIPANTVRNVARQIIAHGAVRPQASRKPWLGIQFTQIPPDVVLTYHLDKNRGVMVDRLLPNGPAEKAGLEAGSIILSIDGREIGDPRDVKEAIADQVPGSRVTLQILRPEQSRRLVSLTVTLEAAPAEHP